tara:strand:- start:159 stop:833 length:675 start_codon:yes stop_codon:yes gene_type:complete
MKKKVLMIAAIAAGVFTTTNVNAQEFKPAGGEKNVEVNFSPLGGSPIGINNLRLRYFTSSDMAIRVGFSVTSSSTTGIALGGTNNDIELENVNSSFGFSINPGIEKHFEGTDRLSPYVGAELNFALNSSSQTQDVINVAGDGVEGQTEVNDGSTTFGLNLLVGADWYFSKHIYMGTEVGFGFASTSNADTENVPLTGDTVETPNGGSFNLGPNFNSAIRLGFLF